MFTGQLGRKLIQQGLKTDRLFGGFAKLHRGSDLYEAAETLE